MKEQTEDATVKIAHSIYAAIRKGETCWGWVDSLSDQERKYARAVLADSESLKGFYAKAEEAYWKAIRESLECLIAIKECGGRIQ